MIDPDEIIGRYKTIGGSGYLTTNKGGTLHKSGKALPWYYQLYFAIKGDVSLEEIEKAYQRAFNLIVTRKFK